MEFKRLMELFKRWLWLLVLGPVLGAACGILISRIQTPVYEATARTLVMRAPDQTTAALAYLSSDELATTFSQLITTQPVLDELSNQLGVKVLKSQIQVQLVTNSQVMKVIVDANDSQMSAKIANGLVDTAIKQYVALQIGLYVSSEANVQAQLNDVQTKISDLQTQIVQTSNTILSNQLSQVQAQMTPLQDEISQLNQDIALLTPSVGPATAEARTQIAQKQARIAQIQPLLNAYNQVYTDLVVLKKPTNTGSVDENNLTLLEKNLAQYQQNNADLTSRLNALHQAETQGISNVIQIEKAYAPVSYIRPQVSTNTLLSMAVGLILAIIGIFMLENMDISFSLGGIIRKWLHKGKPGKLKSATANNRIQ